MGDGYVCIIPGPHVVRRAEYEETYRWCFGCRRRVRYNWTLQDYDERSPHYGWYEPIWIGKCPNCHKDRSEGGWYVYA